MLYQRVVTPTPPPPIDKEAVAMLIHTELKKGASPTDIYRNNPSVEKIRWVKLVYDAVRALERQIILTVRDNPTITATAHRDSLSHPWLDTVVVGNDVVAWSKGDPGNPPSFVDFKAWVVENYPVPPPPPEPDPEPEP